MIKPLHPTLKKKKNLKKLQRKESKERKKQQFEVIDMKKRKRKKRMVRKLISKTITTEKSVQSLMSDSYLFPAASESSNPLKRYSQIGTVE